MLLISLRRIGKSFGELEVLKNVNLDISDGERIGLVGRNGAGKTTMANIVFGSIAPDSGNVLRHGKGLRIGYLMQSTSYTLNTFNNMLNNSNDRNLIGAMVGTAGQLGLEKIQEWDEERFSGMSGGERTKLALANVWITRPHLLILDEPTNHLDNQGIEWLIKELSVYQGSVLIISHDRYFLDQAVSRIVELEDGKVNEYHGNYTFYRDEKLRKYNIQLQQYINQKKYEKKIEQEIMQLKSWSEKAHRESTKKNKENKMGAKEYFRVKAKKMDRQVKSKIKRLEKLRKEGVDKPKEEKGVYFDFEQAQKTGRRIIEAKSIGKKYGDRLLFNDSSFFIQRGEKVGLIGPNGCGKTTLLKIIMGEEHVDFGDIWVSPSVKVAYMCQDVSDLDEKRSTLDIIASLYGRNTGTARTILANMGFDEDMLNKPVGCLSLGERMRIKIIKLVVEENSFLILDEPTNHLDLHSRERLEETLENYNGTLLLVSHDRYLLERICDKLLVFNDGRITRLEIGYREYISSLKKKNKTGFNAATGNRAEEKMLIENRISAIIGELSNMTERGAEYEKLDAEFRELVRRRRELEN